MRDFTRDLRFAVRGALRRPGYALAVIATLAVGIGANTAIYSVFNWILFRPIPGVERPEELVTIKFVRPAVDARFFVSYRDVADLRGIDALSGLTASASQSMNVVLSPGAEPERIDGEIVMADYFDVLGVRLREGRRFVREEEQPGSAPAVIISDTLRRRAFAGVTDVVGRQIWINGQAFSIVGVTPPGFHGRTLVAAVQMWVPTGTHSFVMPTRPALLTNRRETLFLEAIGRLAPGATLARAQDQARAIAGGIADFGGRPPTSTRPGVSPALSDGVGLDRSATDRLATMWRLLASAVGLVLLLACANAANLLLARAIGRQRETAVQQAIGASRFRLIRQQLAEGLVLSIAAAAAGLLLATALVWAFDGMRIVSYLPALEGVRLDSRVAGFALLIAVVTAVLFSVAPAIASSRVDLQSAFKDGGTSARRGSARLRASLVVVQVAACVLLVVGAGLFARTLHNLRELDLGVELDGVVTFSADPSQVGLDSDRAHAYFTGLLERLRAAPGVVSAAYVFSPPYSNMLADTSFRRAGSTDQTEYDAENTHVSPGYFATLGIPLLAGRDFTDADFRKTNDATGDVVIVSERLAREVFPDGGAVGSRLTLSYPKGKVVEIVGVAGNVRRRPITNEPEPYMYSPSLGTWGTVAVKSSLPFTETAALIRSAARDQHASLPPFDIEPMSAGVDRVLSEQRLLARFSMLFAAVAALLAAVGIYGMLACAVGERMREFGIRLALGARTPLLLRQVLFSAVRITSIGIAAGLVAAYLTTRALEARLFGLKASDPSTLIATCVVLLAIAILASLGPAVRATRADPIKAIRVD